MTPTMSFGEVGTTTQTMSTGRVDKMHGVGLFEAVKVLERQRLITDTTWTTASPVGVPLFSLDAYKELMSVPDNEDIISMFNFFRASVELTVRLNTNQFYYGALMATLYPAGAAGTRIDSRSVQSPSIISAASEQAIIKKWDYAFPYEWVVPINVGSNQHGLVLTLDVLAPLKFCSTCSPVGITIQVWARFTDIELSYPTSVPQTSETILEFELPSAPFLDLVEPRVEKQSKVVVPAPSGSSHPAQSRDEDDTVTKAITALESVTLGDIASRIPLFSTLSYLVDKPDCIDSQYRIVQDYNVDTFATDVPDISTPLVYRKGRYQDPVSRRIPLSSNLTLSQYAQIPGLLSPSLASPVWQFTAVGDTTNLVRLIQVHPFTDTMRKPLDYAALNAVMWRGSINVMIQFFTTSFISARFVVQYHNPSIFATSPEDSTYDSTLSRVINVKGDTVDCFNLPWLHPYSWGNFGMTPSISLTLDSNLAAPCSTADQVTVYAVIWVAGGPDIQFANPRRIQYDTEWSSIPAAAEKQAMVHEAFQKTFPPIVENCKYDIDNGYCTSEQIGSMADYAKRYGLLPYNNVIGHDPPAGWSQEVFALLYYEQPPTLTDAYVRYWQFRQTPFGQMRSAFLFMSGGFRFRRYTSEFEYWVLTTNRSSGTAPLQQSPGVYVTTQDSMIRASVPYSCYTPYQQLGYYSGGYAFSPDTLDVTQTIVNNETTPNWLAARDDVMFGWPILPVGLASPELPGSDVKGKEKVSLRKATDGSRRSRFVVDRSD